MKKLYRRRTVHPSPPITADHLSFLPAAISTLATSLSPEDKEVLAYLISYSNNDISNFSTHKNKNTKKHPASFKFNIGSSDHDHPPLFTCDCFSCYTSYWVRWDSSPNRQLIHEIIDAFEDGLAQNKNTKSKRDKKKKKGCVDDDGSDGSKRTGSSLRNESSELNSVQASSGEEEGTENGTVRRFVNFIGERIWNVWGQ